jgi:alpha-L-fucosidase
MLNDGNPTSFETVVKANLMQLKFEKSTSINCIILREYLNKGQQVKNFRILLMDGENNLIKAINASTVGRKRILTFPSTSVKSIAISIDDQKNSATISEVEAYLIDENLIERKD